MDILNRILGRFGVGVHSGVDVSNLKPVYFVEIKKKNFLRTMRVQLLTRIKALKIGMFTFSVYSTEGCKQFVVHVTKPNRKKKIAKEGLREKRERSLND